MKHNILVFSSLFPSTAGPHGGLFIRERMFRVAQHVNVVVVSPVPCFPGQRLIRLFKKDYRPQPPRMERQQGITVYFPRFLAFPGLFRNLDGLLMYLCCLRLVRRLVKEEQVDIIDSHFTYPDGLAATWLARRLGVKCTITLRGTEVPHSRKVRRKRLLQTAWRQADRVFAVSDSLRRHALSLGLDEAKTAVIGNGIDTQLFRPLNKAEVRQQLDLKANARVLVTVGGLVERKGFHRVIDCLPDLLQKFPDLVYLVVGGASSEGNYEMQIRELVKQLGVEHNVRFLGAMTPDQLSLPLSAADVFVLASSNEGWANVILEAMACGTPVVATDVGGNSEVICSEDLGMIVEFGDRAQLLETITLALDKRWSAASLIRYAENNQWSKRVDTILGEYDQLLE
ncbi:MAG: glycosyltransferase [Halioglobus sp.]|nr:glycosyltransferase [Halioglobus sp.]